MTTGWQPISTAPKDGTQILAYAKGPYRDERYYGVAEWAVPDPRGLGRRDDWFWPYAIRPTHWMPLPEPPA